MKYNYEAIGKRIKEETSKQKDSLGISLQAYAQEHLHISRSTLDNWTKGKGLSLETLTMLCDKFNCELGYLLCEKEYENKTKSTTDICRATGLSEKAVNILTAAQSNDKADIISHMIESPHGIWDLIIKVLSSRYLYQSIKNNPFSSAADKAYKQVKKLFVELLAPYDTEKEIFIKYLEKEVGYPVEQAEYLFRMEKHAEELPGLKFALSKAFLEIIEEYAAEGHEIER